MYGFQGFLEACILHEIFAEYQQRLRMFLCKTTFAENWFWRVAEFDVDMMKMVFAICMAIWNVVYCLRMCMLDNKLQTFFNLVLFQQLCGREVLWNWFYVFAACERLESMFFGECDVYFSTTFAWPSFSLKLDDFLFGI